MHCTPGERSNVPSLRINRGDSILKLDSCWRTIHYRMGTGRYRWRVPGIAPDGPRDAIQRPPIDARDGRTDDVRHRTTRTGHRLAVPPVAWGRPRLGVRSPPPEYRVAALVFIDSPRLGRIWGRLRSHYDAAGSHGDATLARRDQRRTPPGSTPSPVSWNGSEYRNSRRLRRAPGSNGDVVRESVDCDPT